MRCPSQLWIKACPPLSPQDRDFVAKQKEDLELAMKRLTTDNRREICGKERECLMKKQELLRGGGVRVAALSWPRVAVDIPALGSGVGKKNLPGLLHPHN